MKRRLLMQTLHVIAADILNLDVGPLPWRYGVGKVVTVLLAEAREYSEKFCFNHRYRVGEIRIKKTFCDIEE
jgi:hypothetical protein